MTDLYGGSLTTGVDVARVCGGVVEATGAVEVATRVSTYNVGAVVPCAQITSAVPPTMTASTMIRSIHFMRAHPNRTCMFNASPVFFCL
jgi:hypothetical protein